MKALNVSLSLLLISIACLWGCASHRTITIGKRGNHCTFKSEIPGIESNDYNWEHKETHAILGFNATRQTSNSSDADWSVSGVFCPNYWASYTMQNRVYKDVGIVRIGGKKIPKESHNGYLIRGDEPENQSFESFFGTTVAFEIEGTTESGYLPHTCSLYIPKKLQLSFSGYINTPNRPSVKRNTPLTMHWQADPANTKGVLIRVENDHPVDKNLYPDMNSNAIYATNYILAEDDGSYTFSPADFVNIPDNHELRIVVYRGNVAIEDNGSRKIKFYGGEQIFCLQFCLTD